MSSKDTEPYGSWDGDFTWDGHFLRMHIKTVTQKYDMYDPCTWPLIRQVISTENGADYGKSKSPPEYVAYDHVLMHCLLANRPLHYRRLKHHAHSTNDKINDIFRSYPFNFDRHGKLRTHPHIPPEDLEVWKNHMSHAAPTETREADTKDATANDLANDEAPEDASPEAAIAEILKMLDDTDTDTVSAGRVTELDEELAKLRKALLEANKKADRAEKGRAAVADRYRAYTKILAKRFATQKVYYEKLIQEERNSTEKIQTKFGDSGINLAFHKSVLEQSEDNVKRLEAEVKQSNKDIATANQETAMAKKQILRVLEEMKKKKQGTGLPKKKAVDDLSEEQQKKQKIGL